MKNILFISFFFPPIGGSGAVRSVKFCKFLPACGWRATVLTPDYDYFIRDEAMLAEVRDCCDIIRTPYRHPAPAKLAASVRQRTLTATTGPLTRLLVAIKRSVLFPESEIVWYLGLRGKVERLLAGRHFDLVLSTSPAIAAHLLAARIAAQRGVPWIADFRDAFTRNPFHPPPPTPLHRLLKQRMEERILRQAAAVTTVVPSIRADFLADHPWLQPDNVRVIYNGYDADDFRTVPAAARSGPRVLTYCGAFMGERNPLFLFSVLAELRREQPELARQLAVRFYGPDAGDYHAEITRLGLDDLVVYHPAVAHAESIARMQEADALLFIQSFGAESRTQLTLKVPEYLRAGKPVIALCGEGEARRVLHSAGLCVPVELNDRAGLKQALTALASGKMTTAPNSDYIRQFDYRESARQMAELMDGLVAH